MFATLTPVAPFTNIDINFNPSKDKQSHTQ